MNLLRVLIVEDQATYRIVLQAVLRRFQLQLIAPSTFEETSKLLSSGEFDIWIIDANLSHWEDAFENGFEFNGQHVNNGIDIAKIICKRYPLKKLVIISAYLDDYLIQEYLKELPSSIFCYAKNEISKSPDLFIKLLGIKAIENVNAINNLISYDTSSNTLFHFTKKLDWLLNILTYGFFPRYCLEDSAIDYDNTKAKKYAIPMVCFCDIPLSKIKTHSQQYGQYAIGLTKQWGMDKTVSPVLYTHPNSQQSQAMRKVIEEAKKLNGDSARVINNGIRSLYQFIKPYEGKVYKNKAYSRETFRFYDEREWRYVPLINPTEKFASLGMLKEDDHSKMHILENYQERLGEAYPLTFQATDIRYIIVATEVEATELIEQLHQLINFSDNEIRSLINKIISLQRIKEDFGS